MAKTGFGEWLEETWQQGVNESEQAHADAGIPSLRQIRAVTDQTTVTLRREIKAAGGLGQWLEQVWQSGQENQSH